MLGWTRDVMLKGTRRSHRLGEDHRNTHPVTGWYSKHTKSSQVFYKIKLLPALHSLAFMQMS